MLGMSALHYIVHIPTVPLQFPIDTYQKGYAPVALAVDADISALFMLAG